MTRMRVEYGPAAVELRRASPDLMSFRGYAVSYDRVSHRTEHRDGEVFRRGAFDRSIAEFEAGDRVVPVLLDHDWTHVPVGFVTAMVDMAEGLLVEARMHDRRALASGRTGLSVGFRTVTETRTAAGVREVRAAELSHVALVATPAYAGARVEDAALADVAVRAAGVARSGDAGDPVVRDVVGRLRVHAAPGVRGWST